MQSRILAVVFVALATHATAGVIHVKKDGTGDFMVIQDAVDAAASGDTVMIGPGRFSEGADLVAPGWTKFTHVVVRKSRLTMIGSGDGRTIIGRDGNLNWGETTQAVFAAPILGCDSLSLKCLRFETVDIAVACDASVVLSGGHLRVESCQFEGVRFGVAGILAADVEVQDSEFFGTSHMYEAMSAISMFNVGAVAVGGCTIEFESELYLSRKGFVLSGVREAQILNCRVEGGGEGVNISTSSNVSITDCDFIGQKTTSIMGGGGSTHVAVHASRFDSAKLALWSASPYGSWTITNTEFRNLVGPVLEINELGTATINNCVFSHGGEFVVKDRADGLDPPPDVVHLDLRDNWWGTTDPDTIAAWIYDHNDNEESMYIVDFEPFKDAPVPAKPSSLGGFKAMFR